MRTKALLSSFAAAVLLASCGGGDDTKSSEAIEKVAAPADGAWSEQVVKTDAAGFRMGNPNAPVKIVEYGALSCVHCKDFDQESHDWIVEQVDTGRLSYEFRNFLLNGFDIPLALLARCGGGDSFFPLTHAWYASDWEDRMGALAQQAQDPAVQQKLNQQFKDKQYGAVANELGMTEFFTSKGISKDEAQKCLADEASFKELEGIADEAQKDEVSSTPTFLINGEKYDFQGWPQMKNKLDGMGLR